MAKHRIRQAVWNEPITTKIENGVSYTVQQVLTSTIRLNLMFNGYIVPVEISHSGNCWNITTDAYVKNKKRYAKKAKNKKS